MSFKFGVSFNCYIGNGIEVGGCDEMCDISYVGNDVSKLIAHVVKTETFEVLVAFPEHEYVGLESNVGGSVCNVIGYLDEDAEFNVVAVVINQPMSPEVIE